jgi:hypothetical protein
MLKLIWPVFIVLGILSVLIFDVGKGLDSPGLWLIPIGVIGGVFTVFKAKKGRTAVDYLLIVVWTLAFLSIMGIYFDIGQDKDEIGGGGFIWVIPAFIFTISGLVLLTIRLIKQK